MGLISDREVNESANAFEIYLKYHGISQKEKILKFRLSKNVLNLDEDIKTFGVCFGILIGTFQFQQREVLKNPHIYLSCLVV